MLDIKFVRDNPEIVKENIKKKFQNQKLPLVDKVLELDGENRRSITEASELRAQRNTLSKQVGMLMGQAKKDPSKLEEAEAVKAKVKANAQRLAELEAKETELEAEIHKILLTIPNIIDPSVPIGPDDSANVERETFGEAVVPEFEIPYHTEIMERLERAFFNCKNLKTLQCKGTALKKIKSGAFRKTGNTLTVTVKKRNRKQKAALWKKLKKAGISKKAKLK